MSEYQEEYAHRLERLEEVGLASRLPPPGEGFIPGADSEWTIHRIERDDAPDDIWYVHDLATEILQNPEHFETEMSVIYELQAEQGKTARRSKVRSALSLTLFLPLMVLLWLFSVPSRPGSIYTLGQVILGFGATLSIVGFVVGLFSQTWWLVAASAYWWIGARVIESEAVYRGLYIR